MKRIGMFLMAILLAGCAATSENIGTLVLPTSNKSIDVVLHRSDVKFADCGTLVVIQTYNAAGALVDAQTARGQALHCDVIITGMQVGGAIGAANQIRRGLAESGTEISNSNDSSSSSAASSASSSQSTNINKNTLQQSQGQAQVQVQSQKMKNIAPSPSKNGGSKGGNNGKGNGGNDGSPNNKSDDGR